MSTTLGTMSVLFAGLVILGTAMLACSAKEHTKGEPITQDLNEGSSGTVQDERSKRAADIKIALTSKITFKQRQQNRTGKALQQKPENGTGKALQQRPENGTGKALQQRPENGTGNALQQKPENVNDFIDCEDIHLQKEGRVQSGVFTIKPQGQKSIQVYCDMNTQGGGWTVLQRRFNGAENFDRTWSEYKDGFGDPNKEYWLGNENIYRILGQGDYTLRVEAIFAGSLPKVGIYEGIELSNEGDRYRISIENTVVENYAFFSKKNLPFQAKDTTGKKKCVLSAGWWYEPSCKDGPSINGAYDKIGMMSSKMMLKVALSP